MTAYQILAAASKQHEPMRSEIEQTHRKIIKREPIIMRMELLAGAENSS